MKNRMGIVLSLEKSKLEKSIFKKIKEKIASTPTLSANMLMWYEKVLRRSGVRISLPFWEKLFCAPLKVQNLQNGSAESHQVRVPFSAKPFCSFLNVVQTCSAMFFPHHGPRKRPLCREWKVNIHLHLHSHLRRDSSRRFFCTHSYFLLSGKTSADEFWLRYQNKEDRTTRTTLRIPLYQLT